MDLYDLNMYYDSICFYGVGVYVFFICGWPSTAQYPIYNVMNAWVCSEFQNIILLLFKGKFVNLCSLCGTPFFCGSYL